VAYSNKLAKMKRIDIGIGILVTMGVSLGDVLENVDDKAEVISKEVFLF
jgi:hypothetical protein